MGAMYDLRKSAFVSLAAVLMTSAAALAQPNPPMQIVQAVGEATVSSQPDQVQIDIGVMTESISATTAASENAVKVNQILAVLRRELGDGASIKTISYSLSPNYRGSVDGKEQAQTYQAYNIVRVETSKLEKVGNIADAAVNAGANIIQSVNFMLKEQGEARARALRQATETARSKVETIAAALGMRVSRIMSAEEGVAGGPMPLYYGNRVQLDRAADGGMPVEPGSVDVRAVITITAEVLPVR